MGGSGARFGLIVHHTDAEREYAYDRQSHFGKLDKALDAAAVNKWTVVGHEEGLEARVCVSVLDRGRPREAITAWADEPWGHDLGGWAATKP